MLIDKKLREALELGKGLRRIKEAKEILERDGDGYDFTDKAKACLDEVSEINTEYFKRFDKLEYFNPDLYLYYWLLLLFWYFLPMWQV